MADLTSNDPNVTSGKLNTSAETLQFPVNESLPIGTRLRFIKYNRFYANNSASESTTSTIMLPVPVAIPDATSIRTNSFDLGMFGNVNDQNYDKILGAAKSATNGHLGETTKMGIAMISDAIKQQRANFDASILRGLALAPVGTDSIRNTARSYAGIVQNPHTAMLFEGVNLKSFNLEWRLSPRSEDESNRLRSIIRKIKERIHPEEANGGLALDYPDLCYVEFYGKISDYLPKFQKAFVTSFHATPESGQGPAFFKSGAPISYIVQMGFSEVSIVTRKTLREQNGQ